MALPNGDSARRRRVLVITNRWDSAESWCGLLSLEGYEVDIVTGVHDGQEKLARFAAGVVLVDAHLLSGDGIDLISSLQQRRPGVLCVVITDVSPHTLNNELRQSAYDYLQKPIHPDDLRATLERCFGQIDLEAQKYEMEAALRKAHDELEARAERITALEEELASRKDTAEVEQLRKSSKWPNASLISPSESPSSAFGITTLIKTSICRSQMSTQQFSATPPSSLWRTSYTTKTIWPWCTQMIGQLWKRRMRS
ncbi:MAG: response regulator [Gammaproteobacteria bacterium]|nr:response regulator [Gammaproteobacteria bacterium]